MENADDIRRVRELVLDNVETQREHAAPEFELEESLSVNDWVARIRGAAQTAHSAARTGVLSAELDAWTEIAAIAIGRAEHVWHAIERVQYPEGTVDLPVPTQTLDEEYASEIRNAGI